MVSVTTGRQTTKKIKSGKSLLRRRQILKGIKTAWIFFCNIQRKKLLHADPTLSFGEVCTLLGPLWRGLSTQDRIVYNQLHQADCIRYRNQKLGLSNEQKIRLKQLKKLKRAKHKLLPKPPLSAYMVFVSNTRAELVRTYPDKSFAEIGRQLGKNWHALDMLEKNKYLTQAKVDQLKYKNISAKKLITTD